MMGARRAWRRLTSAVVRSLWPNQRLRWTSEGLLYILVLVGLLILGVYRQVNLVLLIAGLAAGPIATSIFISAAMLRRLRVGRRVPSYTFAGDPLVLEYTLDNSRRWTAALALVIDDECVPVDRSVPGASRLTPRVFLPRVAGRSRGKIRWHGFSPGRGRYRFRTLELATRAPFGLFERRVLVDDPGEILVYPTVGQLSRRWQLIQREATETKQGRRHDRSAQQQEYHGLRDYRPGDSPRWIHWRTSARLGQPMVKEFEQQDQQELAVLLDPWLPRTKVTPDQRATLEQAICFVATLCLETCRQQGRRLLLGWTGPTPGLRKGPASVKLLHEMLEQLAVMRPTTEGRLSDLFDVLPPATMREATIVIVANRPINLLEEAEHSVRLSSASGRGLLGRVLPLEVPRGDLDGLIHWDEHSTDALPLRRRDGVEGPSRARPSPGRVLSLEEPRAPARASRPRTPDDNGDIQT